jgi:type VI secretion system protein ImpA
MPAAPAIDLAPLLAPIGDDAPTGVNLRDVSDGSDYFRLKDLCTDAREAERRVERGDPDASPGEARRMWERAASDLQSALATRTKDLELAAWLIEALVRGHGFAGLRDGFRLVAGLVNTHWDALHWIRADYLDEAEPGAKGQAIASLNGEGAEGALLAPMRRVPITPAAAPGPFAFWQVEAATRRGDLSEIEAVVRETDPDEAKNPFYPVLLADIAGAQAALSEMTEAFREKMGSGTMPPTSQLREALETIAATVRRIAGPLAEVPGEAAEAGGEGVAAAGTPTGAPASGGRAGTARPGTFETREQAFAMLLAVAKFFRDREPHSPLSYTLEEAVRRGRMPLPELLSELLGDNETRNRLLSAAGIRPPPPEASGE